MKRKIKRKAKPKFSKNVIVLLLLSVLIFTVTMTVIYVITGGVPDTLITAFYAFAGGEAGCLGLIKYSDTKFEQGNNDDTEV